MELTPVSVRALDGFKIWIEFNDAVKGEIDLSRFAEQVWFGPWKDRGVFESVRIIPYEAVVWGDDDETDMGLCADALYLELTGKSWEEVGDISWDAIPADKEWNLNWMPMRVTLCGSNGSMSPSVWF